MPVKDALPLSSSTGHPLQGQHELGTAIATRGSLMCICASNGSQKCFAKHPLCSLVPQHAGDPGALCWGEGQVTRMLAWQGCCYGRDAGVAGMLSCLQIRRRCRTVPACGSGSCSQMRDLKMTFLHCSLPRPWDTVAGGAPTGPWADRQTGCRAGKE